MVEYKSNDKQLDLVFHALADGTRRSLLHQLKSDDFRISDLAQHYDVSLNAISKHIKVLEKAGLIKREIKGRTHFCQINANRLKDIEKWMAPYREFWEDSLDNLESYLKNKKES